MAAWHSYNNPPSCHYLSQMNDKCQHCGALHWKAEHLSKSTCQRVYFGGCCNSGKVELPLLSPPPCDLHGLYCGMDQQSCEFCRNILQYNSALAFTSLGVQQDDVVNWCFGPDQWVFWICGQLHHWSSALTTRYSYVPSYAHLYLYDPTTALNH
ncbi:transcriptional factor b3 [Moniliophthora roreri MCA 2997]|uniref:Transcriptional factor b3 n=1 Tax=Moniliophthora roreri (strain MCA 2997) TaxID=1381753 RepID=V2WK48_MONRO|nr:transcriptional factor b3 [Moniliophthora roreri MCA 2997]